MYDLTPEYIAIGGFLIALTAWAGVLFVSGRKWRRYGCFVFWFLIVATALLSLTSLGATHLRGWAETLSGLAAILVGIAAVGCGLMNVHRADNKSAIGKALLLWVLGIGLLGAARYEFTLTASPHQSSRLRGSHARARL